MRLCWKHEGTASLVVCIVVFPCCTHLSAIRFLPAVRWCDPCSPVDCVFLCAFCMPALSRWVHVRCLHVPDVPCAPVCRGGDRRRTCGSATQTGRRPAALLASWGMAAQRMCVDGSSSCTPQTCSSSKPRNRCGAGCGRDRAVAVHRDTVCRGVQWSALVCHGVQWRAVACSGVQWRAVV